MYHILLSLIVWWMTDSRPYNIVRTPKIRQWFSRRIGNYHIHLRTCKYMVNKNTKKKKNELGQRHEIVRQTKRNKKKKNKYKIKKTKIIITYVLYTEFHLNKPFPSRRRFHRQSSLQGTNAAEHYDEFSSVTRRYNIIILCYFHSAGGLHTNYHQC